jgi:hypothetical protein
MRDLAGGKGDGRGYNPLLSGDDDGTMTVAETRLDGVKGFLIVREIHGLISSHRATSQATVNFLSRGTL